MQKEEIVQSALNLLNQYGLEGVTMRRLSAELNVKAPSIYWCIPNKERLLDEMANAILTKHFSDFDFEKDQRDWAEWIDIFAHELRKAMLAYREGARVVAGAHLDVALMLTRLMDFSVRVLHNAGFTYGKATTITVTIMTLTFGYVIEEQASPPLGPLPDEPIEAHLPLQEFLALKRGLEDSEYEDSDTRFNTSVRVIINGVHAEPNASNPPLD